MLGRLRRLLVGRISAEQFGKAVTKAEEDILGLGIATDDTADTQDNLNKRLGDFATTSAHTFSRAIFDGNGLRDVLRGILAALADMIFQVLVLEPLFKSLKESMSGLGGSGGSGGGVGGFLGSIFKGIAGIFGGGGGFAEGGRPPLGVVSVVGERGPELFVPDTAGTVMPAHALMAAGAAPTVIYQIDARGADAAVEYRVMRGVKKVQENATRAALRQMHQANLRS